MARPSETSRPARRARGASHPLAGPTLSAGPQIDYTIEVDLPSLEAALLRVAERAGVVVRHESFDGALFDDLPRRGGLCRLRGVLTLFVDPSQPAPDRVATLSLGLARLDLERIPMPPFVRQAIARQRAKLRPRRRPPLRRVVLECCLRYLSLPGGAGPCCLSPKSEFRVPAREAP